MALPDLAARVPKIRILRKELDYGDAQLARCQALYDDMRVFRKTFVTKGNVPGYKLYEWRSDDDHCGLNEMTLEYLEGRGNGAKFWPDEKASHFYNRLQYSTHHEHIKRNILQLLWRMNIQQYRNDKTKAKQRRIREEARMRRRERAPDTDVPLGSTPSNTKASMGLSNGRRSPPRQSNTSEPHIRASFRAVGGEPTAPAAPLPRMQFEPYMDGQTSDTNASQGQHEDHPELPNITESAITGGRAIFRVFPQSSSPDGTRSADETNNERQAKRTKLRHGPRVERTEYARKKVGPLRSYRRVKPKSTRLVRQRWSGRSRTERQLFGAASQEQLEQLDEELKSPSEDDESSEESGSSVKRKLLVKLNIKPCVASDVPREEAMGNADGAVPGTLKEKREQASPARDLMPAVKEKITVKTTPVRPQLVVAATPLHEAGDAREAQPREEARGCLPHDLPVSAQVQNDPSRAGSASPQAPSATATAGQTLPVLETVTAPRQEVPSPAKEVPAPAKEVSALAKEVPEPTQKVPVQELLQVSGASSLPLTELVAASLGQTVQHEAQGVRQQHEDDTVNSTGREVSPSSRSRDRTQTPLRESGGPQREVHGQERSPARTPQEESLVLPPRDHTQAPSRQSPTPSWDLPTPSMEFEGPQRETLEQESSPGRTPGPQEESPKSLARDHTKTPSSETQTPSRELGGLDGDTSRQESFPGRTPPHEIPRPSTEHLHARYESVSDEEFVVTKVDTERMLPRQDGTSTEVQDEQPETYPEAALQAGGMTAPSMEETPATLSENVAKGPPQGRLAEKLPWPSFTRAATEPPCSRQEAKRVSVEDSRYQTIKVDASTMPPPSIRAANPTSPRPMAAPQGSMLPPTRSAGMQAPESAGDCVSVSNQKEMGENTQSSELPKQNASTQKPTLGKPNIRVRYRVILSRNPVLRCRFWKPKGAFRDKTLAQLREEIPLELGDDTKGLLFRLTGPGLSTDEVVLHGEDEEFEVVKTCFEQMIRACVVAGGEPLIFVMDMEALTDESPAAAAGEVYKGAFEW
ncbi:Uncharacterized protein TPAR_03656 [Tolypocladium paradoxum]|uniref:Uncharacterized protein n=1 Tax=Tolypocladium paradoxum TaxID=94208 RepID=A0A2S4L114_9HYPO|nr:Uncharacterized protein TPAR_03656 [Tolypocladium paradoxum]